MVNALPIQLQNKLAMVAVLAQQAGAEHWVVLNGYHQPIKTYYYIMTRNNQIASNGAAKMNREDNLTIQKACRALHCTADHIL